MCECTKHQEAKYPQDCRECDWEQEAEDEKKMNNIKSCLDCLGTGYLTSGSGQKAPCPFCHDWNKKKTVSDLAEAIKDVCGQQYTIVRKEELNALVEAASEVLEKSFKYIQPFNLHLNLEQALKPFVDD